MMADLPIPFTAPMVRALLREVEQPGTGKTQTRRLLVPYVPKVTKTDRKVPDGVFIPSYRDVRSGLNVAASEPYKSPRYSVGDRLYVREHWRTDAAYDDLSPSEMGGEEPVRYEADGFLQTWGFMPAATDLVHLGRHRQGMHMPRWASRLTLLVTAVRVERLQDISEKDAVAEGIHRQQTTGWFSVPGINGSGTTARAAYALLWNVINGEGAWDANPWVAAYTFTPIFQNIDAIGAESFGREG